MGDYNPLASIEDIGKMALIDKGIKDVFDQAESIAKADFTKKQSELDEPFSYNTNELE